MLIMHLSMLVKIYLLLIESFNLFGFFRKYRNLVQRILIISSIVFRRTKSLSQAVVDQLKKTLTDMGADVGSLTKTEQNC
jgi:hypothetical protein